MRLQKRKAIVPRGIEELYNHTGNLDATDGALGMRQQLGHISEPGQQVGS